ncbi:MAG: T9SS type A sorting domain-containing protein, partial [Salinivirgaceae bacterium]|nr:T9SS type A sorting domain-containing protein [Salinivirgaceae bacterium]
YYWLEVGNSGCLAKTPEVNVTVNPMPTTPVIEASSASVTICQGEPLSLSIIPTNGESYQWFRNSVAMAGETNDTVSIIETGVYNVVSSIGSCIQTSEPVSVKVNDLPQEIDFSYSSTELTFCSDKTLTITAQGNPVIYKYQWMRADGTFIDGATSNSITVNETGGYLVNVTNPNGCQRVSEKIEITVKLTPDIPVINVKGTTSFCEGLQTTIYTSMNNVSYLWHKVNDSQFSYTNDSLVIDELSESGTYYLVVTNSDKCSATSAGKAITVFASPEKNDPVAGSETNFCEGDSVLLKTAYNLAINTDYKLQWMNKGNIIAGVNTKNYTATESGNYWLEVENSNGCFVRTDSVEVVVDKKPDTPVIKEETNTTNFCPGTEVKLFVDNASSEFEYQWLRSGIEIDGATQPVYGGKLIGGEYSVEVASGTCNAQSPQYSLTEKEAPDKPDIYARGPNIWILACSNQSAIGYRWYYNGNLITGATEYMYIANQNLGDYYVEINEGGECWTMSDIIDIPSGEITGVDGLMDETVSVFPNPSEGIFTISLGNYFPGTIHVTITNEIGNALKIQEFTGVNGFEMELTELPHGIYFGKIEYQGKVVMKKLVRN